MEINYKKVLEKYMDHITDMFGDSYVSCIDKRKLDLAELDALNKADSREVEVLEKLSVEDVSQKRAVCGCGEEMRYVKFTGYYDELEFWRCPNDNCKVEKHFFDHPDVKEKGAYA
jgi:hypothetical protein